MKDLENIVLLIDADNTPYSKLDDIIREISAHGRIVVKRAYGNWKKEALKNWEDELKRLAIRAMQQFDYVSGKNATDMALVIDAMKLLHENMYDSFVIVASDSDYTPLANTLRESLMYIMGVGAKMTPEAFRNSCDEFIFLENIGNESTKSVTRSGGRTKKDAAEPAPERAEIDEIHDLLKLAADKYQDDDGYASVSSAGHFIKRAKPDFDVRTYGYNQLLKFFEAFPKKYDIQRKGSGNVYVYRCIEKQPAKKKKTVDKSAKK